MFLRRGTLVPRSRGFLAQHLRLIAHRDPRKEERDYRPDDGEAGGDHEDVTDRVGKCTLRGDQSRFGGTWSLRVDVGPEGVDFVWIEQDLRLLGETFGSRNVRGVQPSPEIGDQNGAEDGDAHRRPDLSEELHG